MTPDEIKDLRKRFNISQETLAREIGVSVGTVNRWEAGKAKPIPIAKAALRKLARKKSLGV